MKKINKYQINSRVHESSKTLVLRATDMHEQSVILKLSKPQSATWKARGALKKEFDITHELSGPGVIETIGLETCHDAPTLILEDIGGESLNKHPLPLPDDLTAFFNIALSITHSLSHIHQRQVIHGDINPSNIVWNATSGQVKLIDFGIASKFLTAPPKTIHSHVLEGTLAYMSPEQTGRMNRTIDYRTDFYSLGITFYHLLSGHPPFNSEDPQELVYCHIAKNPPPLS